MIRKNTKKTASINPVLIGAVALFGGYMLADYLGKQKMKDALISAQQTATKGNQSGVQTIANLYSELEKSGWLNDFKNSTIFKSLKK